MKNVIIIASILIAGCSAKSNQMDLVCKDASDLANAIELDKIRGVPQSEYERIASNDISKRIVAMVYFHDGNGKSVSDRAYDICIDSLIGETK